MAKTIRPDSSVRRVLAEHPSTRAVFLRHGEEPDRPVCGHLESLRSFARRRGVDLGALLRELAAAAGAEVDERPEARETAHRAFLVTALALTLVLGAGWGAHLLVEIGWAGSFEAVAAAKVVAHGMAQLWGFVTLFVVGVSMRYLPWATGRSPASPRRRRFVLVALASGVVASYLWSLRPAALAFLGPASGVLLLAGALGHGAFLQRQLRGRRGTSDAAILLSGAWLLVWGVLTLALCARSAREGPGAFSETERQVLMDLPLLGFALSSVYGFGERLLPAFLAPPRVRRAGFAVALPLHHGGLALALLGRLAGVAALTACGLVLLLAGAVAYVAALDGLRARPLPPRPEAGPPVLRRYVQAAFAWLLLSLAAIALGSGAEAATGRALPHAVHGAVRHALTVGFLLTLVMGVAQRLVPILGRTLLAWPALAGPVLVLVSAGNLLRVTTEVATVAWPAAFAVMPFSALLEMTAIALFTASLARTLWPRPDPVSRGGPITGATRAAALFEAHPWVDDLCLAWGLGDVRRRLEIPPDLTLGSFLAGPGVDVPATLERLERERREREGATRA